MSQIKIENCEFSYRCPKTWDGLLETNIDSVRFCDQCDRNVYLSRTPEHANANAARRRCVAVPIELTSYPREQFDRRLMVVRLLRQFPPTPEERLALQTEFRNKRPRWIGIDGCRAGWFYVGIGVNNEFSFGVLAKFSQISFLLDSAALVLVDIPIGLPSKEIPDRKCESLARKLLERRRSSIFSVPARSVLSMPTYEAANEENRRSLGVGLSKQSWAIVPKIREVDHYLLRHREKRVHEMHPEVAFWTLNQKMPMKHNKRTEPGLDERLEVLVRNYAESARCFDTARKAFMKSEVANDDIIDAMVGAVTAMKGPQLVSLPTEPLSDEEGLRMEMVFAEV